MSASVVAAPMPRSRTFVAARPTSPFRHAVADHVVLVGGQGHRRQDADDRDDDHQLDERESRLRTQRGVEDRFMSSSEPERGAEAPLAHSRSRFSGTRRRVLGRAAACTVRARFTLRSAELAALAQPQSTRADCAVEPAAMSRARLHRRSTASGQQCLPQRRPTRRVKVVGSCTGMSPVAATHRHARDVLGRLHSPAGGDRSPASCGLTRRATHDHRPSWRRWPTTPDLPSPRARST